MSKSIEWIFSPLCRSKTRNKVREDTVLINYPVMQTPNEPNFYLKHNFEKEYSDLGTPYVQEDCDIAASDNLVIYGHHIKGQKMFGALDCPIHLRILHPER